jgi:hypothetical protein
MKRLAALSVLAFAVATACGQANVTSTSPASISTPTIVPSDVPTIEPHTSVPAPNSSPAAPATPVCKGSQVELVAEWLPDVVATVILARRTDAGGPCLLNVYPPARIVDQNGATLDQSRHDPPPVPWPLVDQLELDFSWGIVCPPPMLARPLTASITIVRPETPAEVVLPPEFEPSCGLTAAGVQVAPAFDMNGEGGEGGSGG